MVITNPSPENSETSLAYISTAGSAVYDKGTSTDFFEGLSSNLNCFHAKSAYRGAPSSGKNHYRCCNQADICSFARRYPKLIWQKAAAPLAAARLHPTLVGLPGHDRRRRATEIDPNAPEGLHVVEKNALSKAE